MSEAFKCDRCGKLVSGKSNYAILYGEHEGRYQYEREPLEGQAFEDLCEDCHKSLDEFMDGKGQSREVDCRTERTAGYLDPATGSGTEWDISSIRSAVFTIKKPLHLRRTVLQEQVDMGARNY